jgi:hypothetical protein
MAVESSFTVPDVPDTVSFADAIALTQTLLDGLEQGIVAGVALESTVRALVVSANGARGFFVTYLSDDRSLGNQSVDAIIAALQSAPAIVSPLLVKNLAMSTAMAITHRRNQDEAMVKGSEQVRSRTTQLIQRLQLPQVEAEAQQLSQAIETKTGAYQTFLERWGYDVEQRQAMQQALEAIGLARPAPRPEIS